MVLPNNYVSMATLGAEGLGCDLASADWPVCHKPVAQTASGGLLSAIDSAQHWCAITGAL